MICRTDTLAHYLVEQLGSAQDWGLAFAVASSILLLDEGRKLLLKILQCNPRRPT